MQHELLSVTQTLDEVDKRLLMCSECWCSCVTAGQTRGVCVKSTEQEGEGFILKGLLVFHND